MDGSTLSLIVALVVLLALSAFFSASETAFSSLNRIRLKSMAAEGDGKAKRTLGLAERYDKLLSSVLIGNNIVNILSTSLATVLFVDLFGSLGVTIATVVMTVLVLVFGEITPKTLAKEVPEKTAVMVTPALRVIMTALTPVNAIFSAWKKLILKIFKLQPDHTVTDQELLTYVEDVREEGTITEREEEMIRSVIEFDDVKAIEICTPRVDVQGVELGEDNRKIAAEFYESGFSRLPVYRETLDQIVGIIIEKDFHYYVQTMGQPLEQIIRPALYITKNMKISLLLTQLQQEKIHIAVIVDEYGGTVGIVTIEDILEELVGEIWDEHDEISEEITEMGPGKYRIYGGTELEEVFDLLGWKDLAATSLTLGGWVLENLGHIPKDGETFAVQGWDVTVETMHKNRVYSVVFERAPEAAATEGENG